MPLLRNSSPSAEIMARLLMRLSLMNLVIAAGVASLRIPRPTVGGGEGALLVCFFKACSKVFILFIVA
jgi:hypothetical protein